MINPLQLHQLPTAYDLAATTPDANSTVHLLNDPVRSAKMAHAFKNQVRRNTVGTQRVPTPMPVVEAPYLNVPENRSIGINEQLAGSPKYGSNNTTEIGSNVININPNANKAYFMHELGHIASREGKFGGVVRAARNNPMLTIALGSARFVLPVGVAAMLPGDDDLAQSLVASYLASAPAIMDEALATKNALAMMNKMGERATLGQRGRLAGSFLSYLGAPMIAGLGSNYVGNLMDDEIAERLA